MSSERTPSNVPSDKANDEPITKVEDSSFSSMSDGDLFDLLCYTQLSMGARPAYDPPSDKVNDEVLDKKEEVRKPIFKKKANRYQSFDFFHAQTVIDEECKCTNEVTKDRLFIAKGGNRHPVWYQRLTHTANCIHRMYNSERELFPLIHDFSFADELSINDKIWYTFHGLVRMTTYVVILGTKMRFMDAASQHAVTSYSRFYPDLVDEYEDVSEAVDTLYLWHKYLSALMKRYITSKPEEYDNFLDELQAFYKKAYTFVSTYVIVFERTADNFHVFTEMHLESASSHLKMLECLYEDDEDFGFELDAELRFPKNLPKHDMCDRMDVYTTMKYRERICLLSQQIKDAAKQLVEDCPIAKDALINSKSTDFFKIKDIMELGDGMHYPDLFDEDKLDDDYLHLLQTVLALVGDH